jgi:hypothetical protein
METRPIPGVPTQYLATDKGTILNLKTGNELFGSKGVVSLSDGGKAKSYNLPKLICLAFHGYPPEGKPNCCHNDGKARNCKPSNLRWDSQAGNIEDKRKHGTQVGNRTMTWKQVLDIRASPLSVPELARLYNRERRFIRRIVENRTWADPNQRDIAGKVAADYAKLVQESLT